MRWFGLRYLFFNTIYWHLSFISYHFFALFAFRLCDTLREMPDYQFLAKTRQRENAKKNCKLLFVVYEKCQFIS